MINTRMIPDEPFDERQRYQSMFLQYLRTVIVGIFLCVTMWLTHVVVCLSTGQWGFLIAGAIFFPIAIIHGIGIWLGIWPGVWY